MKSKHQAIFISKMNKIYISAKENLSTQIKNKDN